VAGLYGIERQVDLLRTFEFLPGPFTSTYRTGRVAAYGQLASSLTPRVTLTTGLRYERREAHYGDSEGVTADPSEDLWGARATVDWLATDDLMLYGTVARGYKAGGINTNNDPAFDESLREFDAEGLWNYELGVKGTFADGRVSARVAAFYMDRADQQVETSATVTTPSGVTRFLVFTDNAAEGTNYGLEAELDWAATERLEIFGSLGLLETEYEDFVNSDGDDLSGREQAHAPSYQFTVGGTYRLTPAVTARVSAEGRDAMFWDTFHDEQARSYALLNARLAWRRGPWAVELWGRNLTDENYGVRGFGGFVNDPRDFGQPNQEYIQFGEQRVLGLTARWER
jgi:outer membrane receptor protein involved in Fe transport